MHNFLQDIRYGVRILAKYPGFTALSLVALALGIGANTAMFSVVNGVLLRPLPFPDSQRLVWIQSASLSGRSGLAGAISPPDFKDYREQNSSFEQLVAFVQNPVAISGNGEPERLQSAGVSWNFFEMLRQKPLLGRAFLPEDEQVDWPRVVVLSNGLWKRRFGADPTVVGRTITLDGKSLLVIGVASPGFRFPEETALWMPLPMKFGEMSVRRFHFLRLIGRLKPTVGLERAHANLTAICRTLEKKYPASNSDVGVRLMALQEHLVGKIRPTLVVLMVSVGFVLLIACANVAGLLLARARWRQREVAIRSSLGASPLRVVRQLMAENLILALGGGVLGVGLAQWGVLLLVAMKSEEIPRLDGVTVDTTVLLFTLSLSVATALIFGITPALQATRINLVDTLKEGVRGAPQGRRQHRLGRVLVSAEICMTLVLLIGTGLMLRTLQSLIRVNPGFKARNVATMQVSLPFGNPSDKPKWGVFFLQLLQRLRQLPGVENAGMVSELPLTGQGNDTTFNINDRPVPPPGRPPNANQRRVAGEYFRAMSIPLLRGRYFNEQDSGSAPKVVIVSDSLARRFFPHQDPIGKRLTIDFDEPFDCQIVGVVGTIHHESVAEEPYRELYVPIAQSPVAGMNIVIRSKVDPWVLAAAVKEQVQQLNNDLPVYEVRSMEQILEGSVGQPRFRALLFLVFGTIAVILALAGVYGVMARTVADQTHEIGIRMALGARAPDVLRMFLGRGFLVVAAGMGTGILIAITATRFLRSLLFGVSPVDPITYFAVSSLFVLVAGAATFIPARRATKVDPLVALRYE